jgi:hypothetical protein
MTVSYNPARAITSRSNDAPWLFFIPAVFIGIIVFDSSMRSWIARNGTAAAWIDVGIAVVIGAIWYFGFARVPNSLHVRTIRRQVLDQDGVWGAALPKTSARWLSDTLRREGERIRARSAPSALVATKAGLQIWGGAGNNTQPLVYVPWGRVQQIGAPPSQHSALITVDLSGPNESFGITLRNTATLSTTLIRNRRLRKVVASLETLRTTAQSL